VQLSEERERHRSEGIEKIKEIINQYSLDINDIFPHHTNRVKTLKTTTKKVAPKYRNPQSGETWTGRGKEPLWIVR
jgi:DNA-binding protein H-NS